jgi:hypothetical protein
MDRNAVRSFVARDWELVAASKRNHRAARFRASRGKSSLEVAQMLREYMRRVRPGWPGASDRQRDLADHIALKRLLDRAARAFSSR